MNAPADHESLVALMPFAAGLGMRIDEADANHAVASLPWRDDLCTTGGIVHGGALMSFADTLGAVVTFLGLPEGAGTATITSSTQLMRAATGDVTARAVVLHRGRTTVTVQTTVHDGDDRIVSQTTQVQAVLAPRG
jgi:1,4-dihydroxy-2-naphthoyl-CoA hydrolase